MFALRTGFVCVCVFSKTCVSSHLFFISVDVSTQNVAQIHSEVCIFVYLLFRELVQFGSPDNTTTPAVILTIVTIKEGTFI